MREVFPPQGVYPEEQVAQGACAHTQLCGV